MRRCWRRACTAGGRGTVRTPRRRTRVIAEHPEDFRGYLAKGVFFREVGKPSEADNLFRQAKSLAPKEMADVVNVVVQQAKQQN